MLIQEINENNFEFERLKGKKELDKKFDMVDDLMAHTSSIEAKRKFGKLMIRDPTCWAYTFLKDEENNRLKLYPFQDRLINDKNRFILCAASNQIGKTWDADVKILHHALHVNSATVLVVSRSEKQTINVLDSMKFMMKRSDVPFEDIKEEVANRTELHLKSPDGKGTSRIICVPATESALGFPATLLVGDEISFWENGEYLYEQVLEPRTNATKNWKNPYFTMGQIFLISNPNGQQGISWKIWSKDKRFNLYRYCWLANPNNTLKEYKDAQERLPSDRFDSIYAATFTSARGGFITRQEFEAAIKAGEIYEATIKMTEALYLGGDFAGEDTHSRDVDESVLYGIQKLNPEENSPVIIVYCKQFAPRTPKKESYDEIEYLKNNYNINLFAYDKVGVGDSVKNDLMDRNILTEEQIEPLTYSLPNKSEVYYNLKHLFEQRKVIIPPFDELNTLKEQLMNLKFIKTPGGHIQVHGAGSIVTNRFGRQEFKQDKHDDHADAFANACYAARLET